MALSAAGTPASSVGRPEKLYPSPFFDIARNYLPQSVKDTFQWCLFYQLTNPLINAVTQKLSTYPITDLVYEDDNESLVGTYRHVLERDLNIRTFLIEQNLDRYTYGNSFASVAFPFKKTLQCPSCKKKTPARDIAYKFRSYQFFILCGGDDAEGCGYDGPAKAIDAPVKDRTKIRLIRWNPASITVSTNELTGHTRYYYDMPRHLKNQVGLGTPDIVENTPQPFLDALRKKKTIQLAGDKLFHSRRPSISRGSADLGWGTPLILPVLKDLFFLQILRKAQEALALEHIVPMRVMFPQLSAEGGNPYANINLKEWQTEVKAQIDTWKRDPNYIPVMPVPIGQQTVGGQGKAYLLHQELRVYNDQILGGMGVPTGFFYGELQYSGGSVNLRALENEFLGNRQDMIQLVRFAAHQIGVFLDLPTIRFKFRPFKMADDIQRSNFDMQLNQNQKISTRSFLQRMDYNYESELEMIKEEGKDLDAMQREAGIAQATNQGEQMLVQTRYQIQSQKMQNEAMPPEQQMQGGAPPQQEGMPQEGAPPPEQQGQEQAPDQTVAYDQSQTQAMPGDPMGPTPFVDLFAQAKQVTRQLNGMDDAGRYQALARIRASSPELFQLVQSALNDQGKAPLKPLPEVLPPRAAPDRAQI